MVAPVEVSVLVLTEDSGTDASAVVQAVTRRLVAQADGGCQTQLLSMEPLLDEIATQALRANFWKSASRLHHRAIVTLREAIATKLLEENGFVVFHVDADRKWSESASSENARKFELLIRERVAALIDASLTRGPARRTRDEAMARLLVLLPHYSIESWLYQNTREAVALCKKHHGGRDAALFESWAANRTLLDEVDRPKELTCLREKHNLALAKNHFPAREVASASPSFACAVETVRTCDPLIKALGGGDWPRLAPTS